MKNLFNKLRRVSSKTKIAVVIALLAIAVPATINAWGPDRQLFTMAKPATFVTFNSITDNSVVGDERNFVVIKDAANTSDGGWKDNITVERGKEYLVRVYVHNNAADNLGLKALNTRVSAGIPTNTAKSISISGFVTSDNATPKQVWDDASFNSSENFNLAYVAGSAEIYNNGYARGGKSLPDSIVTSAGAKIGFDGPDGVVPGCFKYDNFIFFKVKPQFAPVNDYSFTKQVRKEGSTEWSKSIQANPGDTVEYMLSYKNTGEVRQDNVVMRDQMPDKISLINDTTYLKNGTNPNGLKISNNINTATGVNIGGYNAQAAAYVKYSAKVASVDKLVCGKNDLVNKAKVVVDGTQIEDSATVTVNKDCPKPTNPKIDITKKVNGADSATVEVNKPFVYTVVVKNTGDVDLKDAKVSDPAPAGVTFQSADRGSISNNTWNYTISSLKVGASETFKITAIVKEYKEGDIKNTACVDTPTIPGSPDDCDDATVKVTEEPVPPAPEKEVVCELDTKKVITIDKSAFDDAKHSRNLDDCKETEEPQKPITPVIPGTPDQLPQTGAADGLLSAAGLFALVTSTVAYAVSRRSL